MAVVLSSAAVVDSLTEIGAKEALIQNPNGGEDRFLNAAWWLAMSRGLVVYFFVFILASPVSRFYGNRDLASLVRVGLLGVVFTGAMSSRAFLAVKEMKFARWALINHGGGICGALFTVGLACVFPGVWALAIGCCAEGAARCALSFAICPYLPRFRLDREAVRELLRFSKGLFGLSFFNLIFSRADVFVLAKLYSPAALGLYTMAVFLVQTPASFLLGLLGQSLLPAMSRIQGDARRTGRVLLRVSSVICLFGLPVLVFVVLSGRSLLLVFYGSRYTASAAVLSVAALVALVNLLNGQITIVFYARGLPQLHRRSVAAMALMMLLGIYPISRWFGPVGGQIAALVSVIVGFSVQALRVGGLTSGLLAQYARSCAVPALVSVAVVAMLRLVGGFLSPLGSAVNIALGLFGCILTFAVASVLSLPRHRDAV